MKKYLSAGALCLLFLALRWNSFNLPLIRDEGEYAYAAQLLGRGLTPYDHSFLQKPPMVAYSYAFAGVLAPHTFWFPRVVAFLFVGLATVLAGLSAWREFGPEVAWSTMWLLTPMVLQPGIEQFTANTEMFMLLPLMATVALFVYSRRRESSKPWWLLAGCMAAITFWYKYTALPMLVFLFAAWSAREWQAGKRGWALFQRAALAMLGALVTSGILLACFLVHDWGKRLWECTVEFNRFYSATSTFGLNELGWRLGFLWENWWILFLLLPVVLVNFERRVWFWFGMFLAAWVATGASIYGHYYVVLAPFWALLVAVALTRLAGWLAGWLSWSPIWLGRGLSAAVVILVCMPHWSWVTRSCTEFAELKLGGGNPFVESVPVAARVAQLTGPGDYVYVAGSEPQILCYARRLSPTRFVIAYPLMFPSPLALKYQREAIADLETKPPSVVVVASSNTSWLIGPGSPQELSGYLKQLLSKRYEQVGGYVLGEHGGRWTEPLPQEDVPKASLIVFRRLSK
jgi:hypothetical protein